MSEETITPREEIVYKAKLAEQAERYDEMAEFMKEVAQLAKGVGELTVEERNLLSVAYKNAVGSRRASWRIISSVEQKEKQQGNPRAAIAAKYREKVEQELLDICMNILNLLSDCLVPEANIPESKVFYYKMQGDYFRYISEFRPGQDSEWADKAAAAYEEAAKRAIEDLAPTHPIRLGLFLNYSVFYYEIKNAPEKACKMAQDTFDCAITELDHVSEECYKDSTLIMQLLRDNLTLWSSEAVQETGKEEQQ